MSPLQAPDPMRRRVLAVAGAGAAAALLQALPPARAATVDAQPPTVDLEPDGVYASATVVFALPVTLEDALHRGIPLYFLTHLTVSQSRWWWFDASVGQGQQLTRLGFEPLLGKYRVSTGALRASYDTLDDALNQVQHVAHIKVADAKDLQPGETYRLGGRFELDLSQLPRPFQLNVDSQSDWQLEADFPPVSFTWTSTPSTAPPA